MMSQEFIDHVGTVAGQTHLTLARPPDFKLYTVVSRIEQVRKQQGTPDEMIS